MTSKVIFDARLRMITRSARVKRYHTHPVLHTQSVGEHTYGVLWFVFMMCDQKPSAQLMSAAMAHDMHEYQTGDAPSPTKRKPGVREAYAALERDIEAALHIEVPGLTAEEQWTLKMADALEGLSFCACELRQGNREILDCFSNYATYCKDLLAERPYNPNTAEFADLVYIKYADELTAALFKEPK